MFIYWLQTHPNATWSRLVQALRTAGVKMNDVAATLEETFSGKSNVNDIHCKKVLMNIYVIVISWL